MRTLPAAMAVTAAGALASAALAPAWSAWLAGLGFAALAFTLARVASRATRVTCVTLFAAAFPAAGCNWIHEGIRGDGHNALWLSVPLFAAFVALFAGLHAAVFALVDRCVVRGGARGAIWRGSFALAAAWVCAEWLRSVGAWALPWLLVGTLQVDNALLEGLLPLGGVYLAGFFAVVVAALAGHALAARVAPRSAVSGGVAVGTLLLLGALGGQVAWTERSAAAVEVVLLQSNYPQAEKWDDTARARAKAELLAALDTPARRVIVTPETYILDAVQQAHGDYWSTLAEKARLSGAQLLVGAIYAEQTGPDAAANFYNALVHIGPSRVDVYAKRRLVPFGEYMPWTLAIPGLAWLYRDVFHYPLRGLAAADDALGANLFVAGHEVAPSICYELAFASDTARRAQHAAWLVNLSNDAWFDSALYRYQAEQIARTRALENQRWIARANNVGHTALIAPDGAVRGADEGKALLYAGQIEPRKGLTPYQRVGDAAVAVVALLAAAMGVHGALAARRRAPRTGFRLEGL